MHRVYLILIVVALSTGCQTSLPFPHQVIPVIPDSLKAKDTSAKAYAVNQSGHVVGVYSPPAPRKGDQIFVLANGRLIRHEYPCQGHLHANIITNTGLIGGYCQALRTEGNHSFVFSYAQGDALQAIQPAWPTKGYLLSGLTDRGDAVAWTSDAYHLQDTDEVLGFIHLSGQLHLVRKSNAPLMKKFRNAVITESGLVIGGEQDRQQSPQKFQRFIFKNGKFVTLPSDTPGSVKAANSSGHFLIQRTGRSFAIKQEHYREIDCGKEWCTAGDMNNRGWVIGDRHNTYPVPPMGASIGDAFVWINETFYSIDKSVGMTINSEYPLKISNDGHILFHSGGWPYLLAPVGKARAATRSFSGALE